VLERRPKGSGTFGGIAHLAFGCGAPRNRRGESGRDAAEALRRGPGSASVRRLALSAGCSLLAVVAPACAQPAPPPVARRAVSLAAEDLAVIRAAVNHVRQRHGGRRLLVVETTIAVCDGAIEVAAPPPGGCLGPRSLESVSKVLPPGSRLTAMLDFQARSARRLPIAGALGGDVTPVSATLLDFGSASDIVTVSAPSYPAAGVAAVAYRLKGADVALLLARRADGRWAVVE
jgi:hypothetical protein